MVVSDKNVTDALAYLAQTDEACAYAKALMVGLEDQRKSIKGIEFLSAKGSSAAERTEQAYASQAYREHGKKYEDAVADYEVMRNKRLTASLMVEVWRSMNANRRVGNV